MAQPIHRLLVIGCGSIGERHVRTFLATGRTSVIACDNRPAIHEKMASTYGVAVESDWAAALKLPGLTGVVVATPAPFHIEMTQAALEAGLHVLIEKPLAVALSGIEQLIATRAKAGKYVAIGYVYHSVTYVAAARAFLRSGQFGPVRHVAVVAGHDFPAARPAYREIYYRDHAQGGGAIQDAVTHLANLTEWIIGPTTRLYCDAAHQSLAGVEVEDTVNIAARNGDTLVSYALNQFQAPDEGRLDFHTDQGSVRLDLIGARWGLLTRGDKEWTWQASPPQERDGMYIDQAKDFLNGCEGKSTPLCTLEEARQTLRFNLAALQSWRERRPIDLSQD